MMHRYKCLTLGLVLCIALLTSGRPATAQEAGASFVGPVVEQPCDCHTLIAAPGVAGLLYAAGDGSGVFRSEDGGASWAPVNTGLPSLRIRALAVAPSQPRTLYTAIGATPYRSDDGGDSWRKVADELITSTPGGSTPWTSFLLVNPDHPEIVHAITEFFNFTIENQMLSLSTDGGATWQDLGLVWQYNTLAYQPDGENTMFMSVVGDSTNPLQRSTDLGRSWSDFGAGLQGVEPRQISFSDATAGYVAAAHGRGVYRSQDGGKSWTRIIAGLESTFIDALLVVDADTALVVAGGTLYRYGHGTGQWQPVVAGANFPLRNLYKLVRDGETGLLYAAGTNGVWSSADDGDTWMLASAGLNGRRFRTTDVAFAGRAIWLAAQEGLYHRDQSGSWQLVPGPAPGQTVRAVAAVPGSPQTIYAGTDENLYTSVDGGASWRVSSRGIEPPVLPAAAVETSATGVGITKLAISPADPQRLYAGTTQGLFISADGGASWRSVPDFVRFKDWPLYPEVTQIALDPFEPETLYVAVRLGLVTWATEFEIFKSVDGGQSWTVPSRGGAGMDGPQGLEFDPATPNRLYGAATSGFWMSEDGGFRWQPTALADTNVLQIAAVPEQPDALLALTARASVLDTPDGLRLSLDGGRSWTAIAGGLAEQQPTSLYTNPADPTAVYVGTEGRGLYRLDLAALELHRLYLPVVAQNPSE